MDEDGKSFSKKMDKIGDEGRGANLQALSDQSLQEVPKEKSTGGSSVKAKEVPKGKSLEGQESNPTKQEMLLPAEKEVATAPVNQQQVKILIDEAPPTEDMATDGFKVFGSKEATILENNSSQEDSAALNPESCGTSKAVSDDLVPNSNIVVGHSLSMPSSNPDNQFSAAKRDGGNLAVSKMRPETPMSDFEWNFDEPCTSPNGASSGIRKVTNLTSQSGNPISPTSPQPLQVKSYQQLISSSVVTFQELHGVNAQNSWGKRGYRLLRTHRL